MPFSPTTRADAFGDADVGQADAFDRCSTDPQDVRLGDDLPQQPYRRMVHPTWTYAVRIDDLGIDLSVLYPSLGLSLVGIADPDVRRAACRAYNQGWGSRRSATP